MEEEVKISLGNLKTYHDTLKTTILQKDNDEAYTPKTEFNPATKGYVDEMVANIETEPEVYAFDGTNNTANKEMLKKVAYAYGYDKPVILTYHNVPCIFNTVSMNGSKIQLFAYFLFFDGYDINLSSDGVDNSSTIQESYGVKYTNWNITRIVYLEASNSITIESNYKTFRLLEKDSSFLGLNNVTEYTPATDYNPATKKYVDDKFISQKGINLLSASTYGDNLDSGIYYCTKDLNIMYTDSTGNGTYTKDVKTGAIILVQRPQTYIFEPYKDTITKGTYGGFNTKTFSNLLTTDNMKAFTPTNDYNPASKKYVDDSIKVISESSNGASNIVDGNGTDSLRQVSAFSGDRLYNTSGIGQSYEAGESSTALGIGTIAEVEGALAIGKYNQTNGSFGFEDDPEQPYVFMIGAGTGNETNNRSNIHTVGTDGAAWYAKDVYVGGTSLETGKKLLTADDIGNLRSDSDDYMKVYRVIVQSESDLTIDNADFTGALKKMVADLKQGKFSGISISVIGNNNELDLSRFCGIYTLDTANIWNSSLDDDEVIEIKTPVSYTVVDSATEGMSFIEYRATISFEMNNGEVSQLTPDTDWLVNSAFGFLSTTAPNNNSNVQFVPTYQNHPTNKYYVDKEIKKLADRIAALEEASNK